MRKHRSERERQNWGKNIWGKTNGLFRNVKKFADLYWWIWIKMFCNKM